MYFTVFNTSNISCLQIICFEVFYHVYEIRQSREENLSVIQLKLV